VLAGIVSWSDRPDEGCLNSATASEVVRLPCSTCPATEQSWNWLSRGMPGQLAMQVLPSADPRNISSRTTWALLAGWAREDLPMRSRIDSNTCSYSKESKHHAASSRCRMATKAPSTTYLTTVGYVAVTIPLKFPAADERLCYGSGPWTTSTLLCP
jgi:hypothetical protein